jgi:hypothetical protein
MASTEIRKQIGTEGFPLGQATNSDESRIRKAMRLAAEPKKSSHALKNLVGGAALVAGGFCLGWAAFRLRQN